MKRAVQVSLSLVWAAGLAYTVSNPFFYGYFFSSVYYAAGLIGLLILLFRVRPRASDALLVLAIATAMIFASVVMFHFPLRKVPSASLFGVAGLLVLGLRAIWASASEAKLIRFAFMAAVLYLGFFSLTGVILKWIGATHPKVLDLYLYSFDASLHVQISFLMGALFAKWKALQIFGMIFYIGIPLPMVIAFSGQLVSNWNRAVQTLSAFLVGGLVGVSAYNLFPALGPMHLFGSSYPFGPLSTAQAMKLYLEPIALTGLRNAMPSMHMTWALLAWWYSRGLSGLMRGLVFTFLVFTVITTLGTGEHYLVDLVVAFSYSLAVESAFSFSLPLGNEWRVRAFSIGILVTSVWLILLRFETRLFWISPLIPWLMIAATIGGSLFLHHRLQQAIDRGLEHPCATDVRVASFQPSASSATMSEGSAEPFAPPF